MVLAQESRATLSSSIMATALGRPWLLPRMRTPFPPTSFCLERGVVAPQSSTIDLVQSFTNYGEIRLGGSTTTSLVSAGPLTNHGTINANMPSTNDYRNLFGLPVINASDGVFNINGGTRLGLGNNVGGEAHELYGTVTVVPGASFGVFGASLRIGSESEPTTSFDSDGPMNLQAVEVTIENADVTFGDSSNFQVGSLDFRSGSFESSTTPTPVPPPVGVFNFTGGTLDYGPGSGIASDIEFINHGYGSGTTLVVSSDENTLPPHFTLYGRGGFGSQRSTIDLGSDFTNDGTIILGGDTTTGLVAAGTLTNNGEIDATRDTTTDYRNNFDAALLNSSSGSFDVLGGTRLGRSNDLGGEVHINDGHLNVAQGYPFRLFGDSFELRDGIFEFHGPVDATRVNFSQTGGQLVFGDTGSLSVSTLELLGGQLEQVQPSPAGPEPALPTFYFGGVSSLFLGADGGSDGAAVFHTSSGTLNVNAADDQLTDGRVLSQISGPHGSNGSEIAIAINNGGAFTNLGTIEIGGTTYATLSLPGTLRNGDGNLPGLIRANTVNTRNLLQFELDNTASGTVNFVQGGQLGNNNSTQAHTNRGMLNVPATQIVSILGASFEQLAGGQLDIQGQLIATQPAFTLDGGTLTFGESASFIASTLNLTSGILASDADPARPARFDFGGTSYLAVGTRGDITGGAQFVNTLGNLNIDLAEDVLRPQDEIFSISGGGSQSSILTFARSVTNTSTINVSGGTTTQLIVPGTFTNGDGTLAGVFDGATLNDRNHIHATVINTETGTIQANGGNLGQNSSEIHINAGDIIVRNGGTMKIRGAGFRFEGGSLQFTPGSSATFGGFSFGGGTPDTLLNQNGLIEGWGSLEGHFENHGSFDPEGQFDIDGNLSHDGTLRVTLGDGVSDTVNVTGAVQLGGTLELSLAPGFVPPLGDAIVYPIISAGVGDIVGNFSVVAQPAGLQPGQSVRAYPIGNQLILIINPCLADAECPDDGNACTIDACVAGQCTADPADSGVSCDEDGLYCTGVDTCDGAGVCVPAPAPIDCNDAVACTIDSCNETTDSCDNLPDHAFCDDQLFCNGVESCDVVSDCVVGAPACDDGVACTVDSCDEVADACGNVPDDTRCDDNQYCNGTETCDAVSDCQAGNPPCVDGVSCTDDLCNEGLDECKFNTNDGHCDNGLFCDGVETCDAVADCQVGTAPNCNDGVGCTDDACNEFSDVCDNIGNDGLCDNGAFCDGAEFCDVSLDCQPGGDPCDGGLCDEGAASCVECQNDGQCNDGLGCTTDRCEAGVCVYADDCGLLSDQCNLGVCNAVSGQCEAQPVETVVTDYAADGFDEYVDGQNVNELLSQWGPWDSAVSSPSFVVSNPGLHPAICTSNLGLF